MSRREPIARFTDELFAHFSRADQRRWAHAYVYGLLGTPGKKTVRRLAELVSDSPTAAQALHQFVNESPWSWEPVCDRLRQWAEDRASPLAWTVAPVVLPKRGDKSCGVHRRFVPGAGRTVNCQVGAAVFMATEAGDLPVGWRLLLPEAWTRQPLRREQARIPSATTATTEEEVLRLVDQTVRRSHRQDVPVVVDLDGYLDPAVVAEGLNRRGLEFLLAVPDGFPLAPLDVRACNSGRAVLPAVRILADCAAEPARAPLGRPARVSGPAPLVQVPGATAPGGRAQPHRLLVRPALRAKDVDQLWITNMVHRPVEQLLDLTEYGTATGETVSMLQRGFGLRDFEGRSYPGWHHHMTLVSAAYAFSRLATATPSGQAADPAPAVLRAA
ncbi:IS701 family transposase [Kitasatospora sp. NPDC096147]|uniref:IS701 family transposase n=1 Tax=Kitasatospora sp. NPDC096147 TaxID=3364093 RepID=UPI0038004074